MSEKFFYPDRIKVAFVTGQHPYDVPSLHSMFRSFSEIDFYPQALNEFALDEGKVRHQYNAVVFYNFHMQTPGNETEWWEKGTKEALEQLGEIDQGIFLLHHAITAFPQWQLWSDITGIQDRKFTYHPDVTIQTEVVNPQHPITKDLRPWSMVDEIYTMNDAGEGSEILLTVNHPESMKSIAWTRQYQKARVFCYQTGHDHVAFNHSNFREVVKNGILWVSRKI